MFTLRLRPPAIVFIACTAALLGASALARAAEPVLDGGEAKQTRTEAASRQYINLRGGASSANLDDRPEICMEGSPFRFLSIESCGTGNGLWHHDSGTEMAHLRLKVQVFSLSSGSMFFQYGVGAGMAELQVAADDPGFQFRGTGSRQAETAGAEGLMYLRALYPLPHSFELVADLQTGTAYLPYASELVVPKSAWQPFVGLTVGFGY